MTSLALNPDYDFRRRFSVPFEEQKRLQEAAEEAQKRPGFGQAFGAAVNTEWITSWMGRQLRAGVAGNEDDPNYSPFADDEWKSLTDGLDPTYWSELGYANSRIHALQIRDNMLSVQRSRETLGRAGAKGIVATFGAAFLDPTIIAATIATGGIAGGARAGATIGSRALRGAELGLAVDVPAEMYLASQDPERGVPDILLAGAATIALGSLGEIAGGALVDRAVRRDTATVRAASGFAMGAASPNDPSLRALRPGETAGIDRIRDIFPGSKVEPIEVKYTDGTESGFAVALPNGKTVIVEPGRSKITFDTEKVAADYGIDAARVAGARGKYKSQADLGSEGVGIIELGPDADAGTLSHEKFHALMDLVLDSNQKAAILSRYGDEEAAAEAFRRRTGHLRGVRDRVDLVLDKLKGIVSGDPLAGVLTPKGRAYFREQADAATKASGTTLGRAAASADERILYRRGSPDGRWWSESRRYVDNGGFKGELHTRSFQMRNTLNNDNPSSLRSLASPDENARLSDIATDRKDVERIYDDILTRNGYDSMTFLDEGDHADDLHRTYYVVNPRGQIDPDTATKAVIADSLRTHLANDGWSDTDIAGLEADPEQWGEAMKLYGNPQPPPNIPSSPATLIGSWDPSRASDASSPLARADRTFAGFASDSRTPADLRFLGGMLFTNPLARGGNGVSIMGADQFARRLRHSSIDGLNREMTPAFRKFQKANGFRHRFESTDGLGKFNEAVIMEVELGPTAGKGPSGDAVREGAEAHRKFYSDWLDRARDGGAIDEDTHAILKGEAEQHGYFPRNPDGVAVREFEVKHKDAGTKALRELYAQSHASKIGELDQYRFGRDVVEALGWNFRSTLSGMVTNGAKNGVPVKETFQKMAGWVSDRLTKSEMFDEDEIAKIVAVATDPDAIYEEFAAPYARAQKFSRMYLATVRGIGTMTSADQLRLYTGKRLQFLREVLDDERFNNFEVAMSEEDVAEIIKRVEKRETEAERGVPSNLRYRSALDNYYVYDATRDLGSTEAVNMTVNDFSERNLWAVADRYARSMSADLALRKVQAAFAERVAVEAEEGVAVAPIKTVAALQAEVEKNLIANGLDPAVSRYGKALKARFEVGIREIASIAQPTSATGEAMRQPLRIWRRFVNSVSNGTFGFAALPESSRILAYGGVVNTINSVPMLKQQLALAREGKMSNEFLDFGDFFANMMTTNELNPLMSAIDPDDPRTFGRNTLMDKAERGIAYIERKSFQATGMFHLERFGRQATAAVAVNKYVNDFARGRQWNAKKLDALGLSPEDAKRVGAAINHELGRENGAVVRVKSESFGHKVTRFRIDQFEDQVAASLLTQSMSKWASRVFQESDVGSKFLIQTDPILRIFTHFMDFTLGGWTKHTLYGVQHFKDWEVYKAAAYGTLLGSAVYIAQSYAMFAQRQDELKKTGADINDFDFFRVFMAGVQRGGHFSILPQAVDFGGSLLKAGTPFDARSSGLTYGGEIPGLEANPSSSYINTVRRGIGGIGSWAFQGDDFSRDDIRAIYKMIPFQRNPVASNIFESMVRGVPEERR